MSADADVGHDGNGVSSPVLGDTHNASAIAAGLVVLCRFLVSGPRPRPAWGRLSRWLRNKIAEPRNSALFRTLRNG